MPKAMANRFGGTRGPRNLCRFGRWSLSTIWGIDIRPPEVAALPPFPYTRLKAALSRPACIVLILERNG
jgi:hypothetical protein